MNKVTTDLLENQLDTMRIRLEDITRIQEETRNAMEKGFKEQAESFDHSYEANSKNRKILEDDIMRLHTELKKKRKSDDMEEDAEEEPQQ
eukprot:2159199-Heterocapsa_arctica.AAC.1